MPRTRSLHEDGQGQQRDLNLFLEEMRIVQYDIPVTLSPQFLSRDSFPEQTRRDDDPWGGVESSASGI